MDSPQPLPGGRSPYESLDFEEFPSAIAIAKNRNRGKLSHLGLTFLRWILMSVLGVVVGGVGVLIIQMVRVLTSWKLNTVMSLIADGMAQSSSGSNTGLSSSSSVESYPAAVTISVLFYPFLSFVGISVIFSIIASLPVLFVEPLGASSGIPEITAFFNGIEIPRILRMKTAIVKVFGVIFSVASGLPVGYEGPMTAIGAAIGSSISQSRCCCGRIGRGGESTGGREGARKDTSCGSFSRTTSWFHFVTSGLHTEKERRDFAVCGAASGISSAFNAPIGGVLFTMEEAATFWPRALTWRGYFAALIAASTVGILLSGLNSGDWTSVNMEGMFTFGTFTADYESIVVASWHLYELPAFLVLGALAGILGATFNLANAALTRWRIRVIAPSTKRRLAEVVLVTLLVSSTSFLIPYYFGTCLPRPQQQVQEQLQEHIRSSSSSTTPIITTTSSSSRSSSSNILSLTTTTSTSNTLLSLYCDSTTEYNDLASLFMSSSEDTVRNLFHTPGTGAFPTPHLAAYFCFYIVLMCISSGLAVPSGIFIPSILAGSAFGRLVGQLLDTYTPLNVSVGMYAWVGGSAVLGGVTRMTISLAVILLECTGNYAFSLPLMLTLVVTRFVGNALSSGIYEEHVHLRKYPVLGEQPKKKTVVQELRASDIMSPRPLVFREVETVGRVYDVLRHCTHNGFFVVFTEGVLRAHPRLGSLAGYIQRKHLSVLLHKRAFHTNLPSVPWESPAGGVVFPSSELSVTTEEGRGGAGGGGDDGTPAVGEKKGMGSVSSLPSVEEDLLLFGKTLRQKNAQMKNNKTLILPSQENDVEHGGEEEEDVGMTLNESVTTASNNMLRAAANGDKGDDDDDDDDDVKHIDSSHRTSLATHSSDGSSPQRVEKKQHSGTVLVGADTSSSSASSSSRRASPSDDGLKREEVEDTEARRSKSGDSDGSSDSDSERSRKEAQHHHRRLLPPPPPASTAISMTTAVVVGMRRATSSAVSSPTLTSTPTAAQSSAHAGLLARLLSAGGRSRRSSSGNGTGTTTPLTASNNNNNNINATFEEPLLLGHTAHSYSSSPSLNSLYLNGGSSSNNTSHHHNGNSNNQIRLRMPSVFESHRLGMSGDAEENLFLMSQSKSKLNLMMMGSNNNNNKYNAAMGSSSGDNTTSGGIGGSDSMSARRSRTSTLGPSLSTGNIAGMVTCSSSTPPLSGLVSVIQPPQTQPPQPVLSAVPLHVKQSNMQKHTAESKFNEQYHHHHQRSTSAATSTTSSTGTTTTTDVSTKLASATHGYPLLLPFSEDSNASAVLSATSGRASGTFRPLRLISSDSAASSASSSSSSNSAGNGGGGGLGGASSPLVTSTKENNNISNRRQTSKETPLLLGSLMDWLTTTTTSAAIVHKKGAGIAYPTYQSPSSTTALVIDMTGAAAGDNSVDEGANYYNKGGYAAPLLPNSSSSTGTAGLSSKYHEYIDDDEEQGRQHQQSHPLSSSSSSHLVVEEETSASRLYQALQQTRQEYAYDTEPLLSAADFESYYPHYPDIAALEPPTEEERNMFIDLRPYMDTSPITVHIHAPVSRTYRLFRMLGLRHLAVINDCSDIVGMITRHQLVSEAMEESLRVVRAEEESI